MGNFEYIALAILVAFCVYLFMRSNKISKNFNEIKNELIKYQTLDENKIDLDNESYPFNKTLKELEETIEKIVQSKNQGKLTARERWLWHQMQYVWLNVIRKTFVEEVCTPQHKQGWLTYDEDD